VNDRVLHLCEVKGHAAYVEGHLQDIFGDLHDARVSQLPGHTHPGVGGGHGVAQLPDGDDDDSVRDHWGGQTTSGTILCVL